MKDIVQETRSLAKASKIKVSEICKAAQVKPRWYFKFISGQIKEPGAGKITRLYQLFKDKAA